MNTALHKVPESPRETLATDIFQSDEAAEAIWPDTSTYPETLKLASADAGAAAEPTFAETIPDEEADEEDNALLPPAVDEHKALLPPAVDEHKALQPPAVDEHQQPPPGEDVDPEQEQPSPAHEDPIEVGKPPAPLMFSETPYLKFGSISYPRLCLLSTVPTHVCVNINDNLARQNGSALAHKLAKRRQGAKPHPKLTPSDEKSNTQALTILRSPARSQT